MFSRGGLVRFSGVVFLAACLLIGSLGTVFAAVSDAYLFADATTPDTTSNPAPNATYAYVKPMAYNNIQVPAGILGLVQKHGYCAKIQNNSGNKIFVPIATLNEYKAFLDNVHTSIPDVTLSACTAAVATCANPPANATMCSSDEAAIAAELVPACSSPAGSAPKCQYVCNSGYFKNGMQCAPDEQECGYSNYGTSFLCMYYFGDSVVARWNNAVLYQANNLYPAKCAERIANFTYSNPLSSGSYYYWPKALRYNNSGLLVYEICRRRKS